MNREGGLFFTGWVYFVTLKNVSPFMGETGGVVRAKRALTAPREGAMLVNPTAYVSRIEIKTAVSYHQFIGYRTT